jgi:hypothetical protein
MPEGLFNNRSSDKGVSTLFITAFFMAKKPTAGVNVTSGGRKVSLLIET